MSLSCNVLGLFQTGALRLLKLQLEKNVIENQQESGTKLQMLRMTKDYGWRKE
jgi:hypothetical protein